MKEVRAVVLGLLVVVLAAIALAFWRRPAPEFKRIQEKYGRSSVGGITSSRCTNEETFLVQKLVRAAFGNNNVDTCARVCHSPTGYGLKTAYGTSAGTQDFDSVEFSDVIMIIGAIIFWRSGGRSDGRDLAARGRQP